MTTPRTLRLHGIPNCDTVKRARAWLAEQGIAHEFVDFKKAGVAPADVRRWAQAVGWDKLINRQGTTWRKLDPATHADAGQAAGAERLALAQPSVIKRPLVEWPDGLTTVGFQAEAWAQRVAEAGIHPQM